MTDLCEACIKDPDPRGWSACYDCRQLYEDNQKVIRNWTNLGDLREFLRMVKVTEGHR